MNNTFLRGLRLMIAGAGEADPGCLNVWLSRLPVFVVAIPEIMDLINLRRSIAIFSLFFRNL